jgi:hypothetical protein
VRALVTGGGVTPSKALIHTLADGGYEVASGNLRPLGSEEQGLAGGREVDISDVGRIVGMMVGCDAVTHLGAMAAPRDTLSVVSTEESIRRYCPSVEISHRVELTGSA